MEKKNKDLMKLSTLLKHWSEHNESHKESFIKWRDIAENYNLEGVVDKLNKAIEMLDQSTVYLLKANEELK